MTLPLNGTLRKALISAGVAAIFSLFAWLANDQNQRVKFLESEAYRVGKLAAGRGERIERLEHHVDRLERTVQDHAILLGVKRRPPHRDPEW